MNSGDISRQKDYLYRVLMSKQNTKELDDCSNSVVKNYVTQHSCCHPTLRSISERLAGGKAHENIVLKKALILFCIEVEKSFVQYLIDRDDTNNVAISQFVCQDLPKCTKQLLDGILGIDDFVTNATANYICG